MLVVLCTQCNVIYRFLQSKIGDMSDQSWHGSSNPMQVSVVTYQGVIGLDSEKTISELVNWLSNLLSC